MNPEPVQPRSGVVLHLLDEVTRKGSKVLHLGCVLGTNDEPEVMSTVAGALGEGTQTGVVRDGVERPGQRAVFGDTLSPELGEMRPNRAGRAEARSGHARLLRSPGADGCRTASGCHAAAARAGMPPAG